MAPNPEFPRASYLPVMPAKAGIHIDATWIPAFAGMTDLYTPNNLPCRLG